MYMEKYLCKLILIIYCSKVELNVIFTILNRLNHFLYELHLKDEFLQNGISRRTMKNLEGISFCSTTECY